MTKNIIEHFDPYNVDHINAHKHLQSTGMLPVDFLPTDVEIDTQWQK